MYVRFMQTRERLITSTQALLWERGYAGTSPRAIQQRADAGQGSMYHHFAGKPELALAAMQRTATEMRAEVDVALSNGSTALERISAYLNRERDILRGCRIGRLTADPDIAADQDLRGPLRETFDWLTDRLAGIVADGQKSGEFATALDPAETAATILATLQGGYVLARAAYSVEPFNRAIRGVLALLSTSK
jgi:TetR/AcrR family transcriptional repressor of nem operon